MIMKNVDRPGPKSGGFKMQFVTMLRSMLETTATRAFHMTILTDEDSIPYVRPILEKYIRMMVKVSFV